MAQLLGVEPMKKAARWSFLAAFKQGYGLGSIERWLETLIDTSIFTSYVNSYPYLYPALTLTNSKH